VHALHLKPRAENELACLESIHLFVEILDTYFSHVCELDLVWHFHKARGMLRSR
jgi:AP-2 complex subunit sigma-1